MKKTFLWMICGLLSLKAAAQQKPHYTQYILNQYILNPALSGIENYTDIKISHRQQWTGIEGAPVTTYLTVHTPIGKDDYRTTATSFAVPGENPRGSRYWESYTAAAPHHGAGLQVINDRTGPLNAFAAYLTYAYHLGLSATTSIAAGFGAGINSIALDASRLRFGQVTVDPAVYGSGELQKLKPDLTAGLYLYSSDFFAGLSAQQILPQKIDFSNNTVKKEEGRMVPHLFATAGYRLLLTEDINLIPSVLVKYIQPVPVQFDINAKIQYRDLLWVGGSYRKSDGVSGMVGLNISNTLNIGYAYDHSTSPLRNYSNGTHEFVLGFLLGNRYSDSCPRNIW